MNITLLPPPYELETKAVMRKLIEANGALSELKGVADSIPNKTILINTLVLQEAKESSAIENIITTYDELYRAQLFKEGWSKETKEVLNYGEALKRGFDLVKSKGFISKNLLLEVQAILEDNDAGFRRQAGTKLKNPYTDEVVYTPPQSYDDIVALMSDLEKYLNDDADETDDLVRMAVIHYQFEKIHPFYDGNGRTGRILNILYLVLKSKLDLPILYLSRYIIRHKAEYYRLFRQDPNQDFWTDWVLFMVEGVRVTALETIEMVKQIRELMDQFKRELKTNLPKRYSKDLLENLFKHPYTRIESVMNDLNVSEPTAIKYLKELEEGGFVKRVKLGTKVYFLNERLYNFFKGTPHH